MSASVHLSMVIMYQSFGCGIFPEMALMSHGESGLWKNALNGGRSNVFCNPQSELFKFGLIRFVMLHLLNRALQ